MSRRGSADQRPDLISDRFSIGGHAVGAYEGYAPRASTPLDTVHEDAISQPSPSMLEAWGAAAQSSPPVLEHEDEVVQPSPPMLDALSSHHRCCDATSQTALMSDDEHPAFGRLVADLGFKRIYVARASRFVNMVPIWAQQRPCNEKRVDEIVRCKRENPELMGAILCFEYPAESGALALPSLRRPQPRAIFDGQHRARAAMRLLSSSSASSSSHEPAILEAGADGVVRQDFEISIEVYPVRSEEDVKRLFLECNRGESIKEIDLPDSLAPVLKAHIDGACEALCCRFCGMFKPSDRCRPPHLHRDTLRTRLFEHLQSEALAVSSADELVTKIMRVNEQLRGKPKRAWPQRLHGALEKARAHGLYLGLDYAWLDDLK
jgi:hypothetical protein